MKGILLNFRGGKHTKYDNHMILEVEGITTKQKATSLTGKKVVWTSPAGKKITGTISCPHGAKGCVRVLFEKGMPGQAVAAKVEVN